MPGKPEFTADQPRPKPDVSIFDLLNAVSNVLKRFAQPADARDIFEDRWTVSEKIEHILRALTDRSHLRFAELFEGLTSRSEVVVTFLALLELIRLRQLGAVQREEFGEIVVFRTGHMAPAMAAAAADGSIPSEHSNPTSS